MEQQLIRLRRELPPNEADDTMNGPKKQDFVNKLLDQVQEIVYNLKIKKSVSNKRDRKVENTNPKGLSYSSTTNAEIRGKLC